jgi:hypothetical protein
MRPTSLAQSSDERFEFAVGCRKADAHDGQPWGRKGEFAGPAPSHGAQRTMRTSLPVSADTNCAGEVFAHLAGGICSSRCSPQFRHLSRPASRIRFLCFRISLVSM